MGKAGPVPGKPVALAMGSIVNSGSQHFVDRTFDRNHRLLAFEDVVCIIIVGLGFII